MTTLGSPLTHTFYFFSSVVVAAGAAAAGDSAGAVAGAACSAWPPASPCISTLSPILKTSVREIAAKIMKATRIFHLMLSVTGMKITFKIYSDREYHYPSSFIVLGSQKLPQYEWQNTTVTIVVHLNRCIDTQ